MNYEILHAIIEGANEACIYLGIVLGFFTVCLIINKLIPIDATKRIKED